MEKLEKITLNSGCRREVFTYEVDWALDVAPDGNNFLALYSEIVNPIIRSGKRTCTTGPFTGEGNYFEYFLEPSTEKNNKFLVHVKSCYSNSNSENGRYKVISAKLFSVNDKTPGHPEFSIGEFSLAKSPVQGEETEEGSMVSWFSLAVEENISVRFQDGFSTKYTNWNQSMYKILRFRICICKESWGNYQENSPEKASNGLMSKISSLWTSSAPPEPGDNFSLV